MKLIRKINRRYLTYSLAIFIFLGLALDIALKMIISEEMDEKLQYTCRRVIKSIEEKKQLTLLEPFISVRPANSEEEREYFSDTTIYEGSHEAEIFRQMTVIKKINGSIYKIIIRDSVLESDDLLKTVIILVLISLLLLFGMLFFLNMKISESVWSPFYKNLEKLKRFSLQKTRTYLPEKSDISEFMEMNLVLKSLTDRVINDYEILKKFSEDASHELQTPLAVIRSKIEALLEENNLTSIQTEKIESVYQSVNRLTRINKDLLLLARIENQQFSNTETISMKESITEKIEYFKELIELKKLQIDFRSDKDWIIKSDKMLIEILLNNLIGNSINHNIPEGQIYIELENEKLIISNTGTMPIEDTNHMFDRFYKTTGSESTGLGLAILKQICIELNLKVNYRFSETLHVFTLYS